MNNGPIRFNQSILNTFKITNFKNTEYFKKY